MMFKLGQIKDWISPPQIEVLEVATPVEQYERIQERVKEVRKKVGSQKWALVTYVMKKIVCDLLNSTQARPPRC